MALHSISLLALLLGLTLATQPPSKSYRPLLQRIFGMFGEAPSSAAAAYKLGLLTFLGDISKVSQNGIKCSSESRAIIRSLVAKLEATNPTAKPARSAANDGYWRLLYTDFMPAAPSSGKLGPFVGDVFQRISSRESPPTIDNILKISVPPLGGRLRADQRAISDNKWEITFDFVQNEVFGIALPPIKFKTVEKRTWKIVFLDSDLKIIRAYNSAFSEEDVTPFIFVLRREQE